MHILKNFYLNVLLAGLTCYKGRCQAARCVWRARGACPPPHTLPAPTPACGHTWVMFYELRLNWDL